MLIDGIYITSATEFRIIQFIQNKRSSTRKEISSNLNLSMPTVFQYVNNLLKREIIVEESINTSNGGRKPKAISIAKNKYASVGMNITRNHVSFVLIDLNGEIKYETSTRCRYADNLDYYLELGTLLNKFIKDYQHENALNYKILGVGISIPGIINPRENALIRSHVLGVSNISLQSFYTNISYPVCVENDANCAAYPEILTNESVVYLSLNNTVGGAVYIDGKLLSGSSYKCAEFGHMIIQPGGKECYCGKKGCLDAYCSAKVLLEDENDTVHNYFIRLKSGDKNSIQKFNMYIDYLAIGISNIRMALDCDIILGGDVGGYLGDYIGLINSRLQTYNLFDNNTAYLKIGKNKTHSSAIGAAHKITDEVLKRLSNNFDY